MVRPTATTGAPPAARSRRDLLRLRPGRSPAGDAGHWIRVHRVAMACRFEVTLSGERAADVPAAHDALAEADRLEAALTVFRPASEVMGVNRVAADRDVPVSDELFDLLARCRAIHRETGGAFDVTTTPLSRAWGFLDRRAGAARRRPAAGGAAERRHGQGRARSRPQDRPLPRARHGAQLRQHRQGLRRAADRRGARRARGGRRAGVGRRQQRRGRSAPAGWPVDVVARAAGRTVARLGLRHAALATSGAGEQFVDVDGVRRGHVIDPRTGWPAAGLLSASVVTDDAAEADALATACFVGGEAVARAWIATHPRTLVILTPEAGRGQTFVIGSHPSVIVEAS